ncbi:unnamed protein product, partial [Mesorhabditis spiculigera]
MGPLFLIVAYLSLSGAEVDLPWTLAGPCEPFVQELAKAQSRFVECATNNSIPPSVCLDCIGDYMNFRQIEYDTRHINVTTFDGQTCSDLIFNNYVVSYGAEITQALNDKIWEQSRCSSCLWIDWKFETRESRYTFNNQTKRFYNVLYSSWRDCVENVTQSDDAQLMDSNSTVCTACKAQFNELFAYYWKIYIEPDTQFCVDIEALMNDTMHLWNDVQGCSERKDRQKETNLVVYTSIALFVLTFLFYMGSYAQGERVSRRLVQYSRLDPPETNRSRLLSSASSANFQVTNNASVSMGASGSKDYSHIHHSLHRKEYNQVSHDGIDANADQIGQFRERCEEKVADLKAVLDECTNRVQSRPNTEETCHQEMCDYIQALDHCALPAAWKHLK